MAWLESRHLFHSNLNNCHCCSADVAANNYQSDDQQTMVQLHTQAYANVQYLILMLRPWPEAKMRKDKDEMKNY